MIVDFAIHEKDAGENGIDNPHFHVMCPIRPLNPDGSWGAKQRREYILDAHGNRIPNGNHSDLPDYEIEKIARCILPDILALFKSEEGQKEFAEWKARQKRKGEVDAQ